MLKPTRIISFAKYIAKAILNSYGMLFFSSNRIFALFILAVSFFTPFTGACGLAALVIALLAAHALGFGKEQIQKGLLTYSVVLFGLGFGTNFEFGPAFIMLLIVGSLLTLFISVALNAILNKRGLPALSLAFIISTALIIIASKSFEGIGLTHRRIYWFNDMYALGGSKLVNAIQANRKLVHAGICQRFFSKHECDIVPGQYCFGYHSAPLGCSFIPVLLLHLWCWVMQWLFYSALPWAAFTRQT